MVVAGTLVNKDRELSGNCCFAKLTLLCPAIAALVWRVLQLQLRRAHSRLRDRWRGVLGDGLRRLLLGVSGTRFLV